MIWTGLLGVVASHAVVLILYLESYLRVQRTLVKKGAKSFDIVIQVVASITEPQGVNVFPRWCGGERDYIIILLSVLYSAPIVTSGPICIFKNLAV